MTDIDGGWYTEKSSKGLPPLSKTKLSKNSQENQDEIKQKLYEANKCWNDWKFQLYRNKLKLINTKYLIKRDKGLPPLNISKINKKDKRSIMKLNKNYMKLISGGMIGNSNCIGTNLNGWILTLPPKRDKTYYVYQKSFTLIKMIE